MTGKRETGEGIIIVLAGNRDEGWRGFGSSNRFLLKGIMTENQIKEYSRKMASAAGVVKLICGVANNAAWMVVLDAYDAARRCRNYRHSVKQAFKSAIEEFHVYERRLLHAQENRMFHVPDMGEKVRKTYGDISDREYYDFWAAVGGPAYHKTRPLITSLWNKHRLSLLNHGVKEAENVAWVLTAQAALELAAQLYEKAVRECINGYGLPEKMVRSVFNQFSLKPVEDRWRRALLLLAPDADFKLEPTEKRNIEMGLTQLCEAWLDPSLLYNSTMETVEDFDEVFATAGYQKKALREIAEVRNDKMTELETGEP